MTKKALKYTLLCSAFLLLSVFILLNLLDKSPKLAQSQLILRANHSQSVFFQLEYNNPLRQALFPFDENFTLTLSENAHLVKILYKPKGFFLLGQFTPGVVKGVVKTGEQEFPLEVTLIADHSDLDQDGFPDSTELSTQSDRDAFREWFISIAESQFYKIAPHWQPIHRHCAGLITFAYKEALKKHSSDWHKLYPFLLATGNPEVAKFNYPHVPLLGTRIFRKSPGAYDSTRPLEEQFEITANVSTLLNFNVKLISRDKMDIQKGDLLFFQRDDSLDMPYHSMIYNGSESLIYHTGPLPGKPGGEVRKVEWETLAGHPDRAWHPKPDNPHFLGIYRFKILL